MIWQILDVRAIWIKEMASALSQQVSTLGWLPKFGSAAVFRNREEDITCSDPPLSIRSFPLQRGFARFPMSVIAREHVRIIGRLRERDNGPLVCTSPHYAPVAKGWAGPVVYYVTDMFAAYRPEEWGFTRSLDRKMCAAATLVCPNSQRVADYLLREAQCPAERLTIIPNATRGANLLNEPLNLAGELPADIADLPRPVAGIIGNLADNTDWVLLRKTIDRTPWLSWVFVGPTEMAVIDPEPRQARQLLMTQGGRVRFVGPKPYGDLQSYARSFDVAVLPYMKKEPTYSGSSTRFYEHLSACRPIIATRGFEELLWKEPLLRLEDSPDEMTAALEELRDQEFHDGFERSRWQASQSETWEARASKMISALSEMTMRDMEAA